MVDENFATACCQLLNTNIEFVTDWQVFLKPPLLFSGEWWVREKQIESHPLPISTQSM